MGAFLRQVPPGEEGDPHRAPQSPPEGKEAIEQLHPVGVLARVEHMVKHDSIQGAQLLLYGHQRIKRLDVVSSMCVASQNASDVPKKRIKKKETAFFELCVYMVKHNSIQGGPAAAVRASADKAPGMWCDAS